MSATPESPPQTAAPITATPLEGPLSIWSYANILLRRRFTVLAIPAVATILGGMISFLSPRQHIAVASFVPQASASPQSNLGQLASQFGLIATRASGDSPDFYADLLQTREALRAVVLSHYSALGVDSATNNLLFYFGVRPDGTQTPIFRSMARLVGQYKVSVSRTTGVVQVAVSTTMPALSAQVADRLLEFVNDFNLQRLQARARAEREFVEVQLAAVRTQFETDEDQLTTFYRSNRRIGDSPQLLAEEARLKRKVDLQQQLYLRLAESDQLARIDEVRNTPLITVVERPDGLVEPQPHHTIVKMFVALFLGIFLAVTIAFASEYLQRAKRDHASDYGEFLRLRGDALEWLLRRPS